MGNNYKKIILVDLDGVLNNYSGNYDKNKISDIKEGAFEFLQELSKKYTIKIFTVRNKILVAKWLLNNGLEDFIEDVTNIKEPAYLYLGDRCICFSGNFCKTIDEINNFKTHWNLPQEL